MQRALVATMGLLAVLVFSAGCQKKQSFEEAMRLVCEAPASDLVNEFDARVVNEEAKQLFMNLSGTKEEMNDQVRSAVRRAGLSSCPLLEMRPDSVTSPSSPLPEIVWDPTLRFAKLDSSVDEEGTLTRPMPWIPDAPLLESLLPAGDVLSLEEEWSRVDANGRYARLYEDEGTHVLHRVQLMVRTPDPSSVTKLLAAASALPLIPRTSLPPIVTLLDPSMAPGAIELQWGAPLSKSTFWGNDRDGRPTLLVVSMKGDGRTVEIVAAVVHEASKPVGPFAMDLPGVGAAVAALERLGGAHNRVEYKRRVGQRPLLMVAGREVHSDQEREEVRHALDHIKDAVGASDERALARSEAAFHQLGQRLHQAWLRKMRKGLAAQGFRRLPSKNQERYGRARLEMVSVNEGEWILWIGE